METNEKFSILVVDDEKTNLDVLSFILKGEYTVLMAKSGEAALKRAAEHKPDLVLLDVIMPDMSGFDVLARLKEADETRAIPVILVTGLASAKDEEKGLALGAVDYIAKPFNNAIVKARVKTHLRIVKLTRALRRLGVTDDFADNANRPASEDHMRQG